VTATATKREGVRAGLKSTGRGLSLAARILLITGVLILLAVGVAVAVTALLAQRVARDAVEADLRRTVSAQESFERQRYERLGLISRVFVSDAALTAYLAEAAAQRQTVSILDLLNERQEDLGFDFAILLDPEGRVVARTDRPDAVGQDLSRRPFIAKAVADFEAAGVWREGNDLFYAVAVPVAADFTLLGYLVSGFAITEAAAKELEEVSRTDVAFAATGGGRPRIVATTLPPPAARALGEQLEEALAGSDGEAARRLELAGAPWLAQVSPLRDAAGQPVGATVALASLDRALAPFRRIEMALLWAGLAAVLLALALTWLVTRRALRPVARLAAAAEAARDGQYDQRIEADRGDEVGRLAQAFNELMAELREKRDMERYVTELSRNLPEPVQAARTTVGPSEERSVLLMAVELRRYAAAKADSDPRKPLELLSRDLRRLANAAAARRGRLETIAGHRALLSFEGPSRAFAALAVAGELLDGGASGESTLVALAAGKVISGPVHWREQPEQGLVGLPVQQLESLLREASPGDIVLSREVYRELHEQFAAAGYELAERRGLVSTQPLYVLDGAVAARVSGVQPATAAPGASVAPEGQATLSGIAPGSLLGQRFEILSVLGAGGMGIVYKAQDRELDDLVALKMLKRELWGDQSQLERLKSEIKLARKITHPNVLRTYDFGEIDGVPYISMEYVRGVTLRYLLDETERLPYSAGLRLAKQLCAGLAAAHAVGVLHRDIKPENLILEATGNAKLMDFGIARPAQREGPGQTQAGWVVGTPQYLSPEQLQGQESDARADIYSCGIVLYELFTGRLPFAGATPVEIMFQHLREEPAPPRAAWPEVPPPLEAAILRCLQKDPAARYPTVADLLHDLEGLSA
jgi:eukaryotic-like serine/threonine-protein kinase